MAQLEPAIRVDWGLRPCFVEGKKALFHKWEHVSEVVAPSVRKSGHPGGTISGDLAIVELEDGQVTKVKPEKVKFADDLVNNYSFVRTDGGD